MYKLNGKGANGKEFEQVYGSYADVRTKEKELLESGMLTVVTMTTREQVEQMSENMLKKFADLREDTIFN